MVNKRIRFRDVSEVIDFIDQASRCDFDVSILDRKTVTDAKSILGVLSMDLSNDLVVRCYGDDPDFDQALDRYSLS